MEPLTSLIESTPERVIRPRVGRGDRYMMMIRINRSSMTLKLNGLTEPDDTMDTTPIDDDNGGDEEEGTGRLTMNQ